MSELLGYVKQFTSSDFILNSILLVVLAYAIWYMIKQLLMVNTRAPPPFTPPPKPERKAFTFEELKDYNGVNNPRIYIGLKGNVYDVTNAAGFYGPSGPYHLFAGRDATRALAKGSFEQADIDNPSIDDLNTMELDAMNDWIQKYEFKYPNIGWIGSLSKKSETLSN